MSKGNPIGEKTIGFIGGGNMAEALIQGLVSRSVLDPSQIAVSDPQESRRTSLKASHGIRTETENRVVAEWADIVVLAIKPQILPTVLSGIQNLSGPEKLFISVAAGVTTARIEAGLSAPVRIVRAMPNTPAFVQAGATALAGGAHATDADIELAQVLFDAVGISEIVTEAQLDAVTGLSGSGPAYVFVMIEALADAGVKGGLPRPTALRLAAQTVMGAAKLLIDTDGHPGQLKDMVTSPGGTTIAGLHALEEGGVRAALINAVDAARERATELGKKP